ncbi:MAG: hypothetical protein COB85_03880 [Bacteroidetes bacterium]|nr:MAG: hypothetical protein COB85_03880 [Bacteroidota bacterium]
MTYNNLLERQIRRNLKGVEEIPDEYGPLLQAISDAFDHNQSDRAMIERSLDVSSEELNVANAKVKKSLLEIEQKNKDITDSINYAQKIQEAIMPSRVYIDSLFEECFVLFKPKDIVSGDFYWFAEKNGKRIAVAADCTGHGVPGAFMSMIGNSLLNEMVMEREITDPGQILQGVKDGIIHALSQTGGRGQQKDGMDMALCAYDEGNKTVEFAGAYNSLYLIRGGELLETKADRMPIGIYEDDGGKTFTTHTIKLQKDDMLYIFTDGFVDQFGGPKGKKFMGKRYRQALADIVKLPMDEQRDFLDKTVEGWKADPGQPGGISEQMDDILIIGIRV